MDARALVEAATRGDPAAIGTLLEQHLDGLRAFVRLRLGPRLRARETSLDVVQSVCREVLGDLGDFEYRGEASFRHWLFLRAEHKLVERARYWQRGKRDAVREEPADAEADRRLLDCCGDLLTPSRHASAREELARAERAFQGLPDDYREVILLSRIVGLPADEIAEKMGRSREAVWQLTSRALARLASLLHEDDPESP